MKFKKPNRKTSTKRYVRNQINKKFLASCVKNYKTDSSNEIVRKAVGTIGSMFASTDPDILNRISFLFTHSVKKKHTKATDQGRSGRCWMFSGLNILRHFFIQGMSLEKFEFSEAYLFFWDKLERANTYLQWFIDNPDQKPGDRLFDHIVTSSMNDGGWWVTFVNLVEKYGLIPKDVMKESFHSGDSDSVNEILQLHLNSAVCYIRKNGLCREAASKFKIKMLENIYTILVKFLGTPPEKFEWSFEKTDSDKVTYVSDLTPIKFKKLIPKKLSVSNFVLLADMPHLDRYEVYEIKDTENMIGGQRVQFLNLPIDDIVLYTKKSVLSGCAVWFAADVRQHFNFVESTLDDQVNDPDTLFGQPSPGPTKADHLLMNTIESNHAMAFTGVNLCLNSNEPVNWQVENSWGYSDHETEGQDGFLHMSHSWFKKFVIQVSILEKFMSAKHRKLLLKSKKQMMPWEVGGAALRVRGMKKPIVSL